LPPSESPAALRVHDRDAGIGLSRLVIPEADSVGASSCRNGALGLAGAQDLFSQVHYVTVIIFIAPIALHIAATLKNALVDRDGIVRCMWTNQRAVRVVKSGGSRARTALITSCLSGRKIVRQRHCRLPHPRRFADRHR
jgi:hypothetical protein